MHDLQTGTVWILLDAGDIANGEFGTEILRLLAHRLRECMAIGARYTRVIDHFRRNGDLTAEVLFLNDEGAVTCTREVHAGGEACRAPTDHNRVIEFRIVHAPIRFRSEFAHEVEARLERFVAGLPLGRAYLIAMLVHELRRRHTAQDLLCIAPTFEEMTS